MEMGLLLLFIEDNVRTNCFLRQLNKSNSGQTEDAFLGVLSYAFFDHSYVPQLFLRILLLIIRISQNFNWSVTDVWMDGRTDRPKVGHTLL